MDVVVRAGAALGQGRHINVYMPSSINETTKLIKENNIKHIRANPEISFPRASRINLEVPNGGLINPQSKIL